MANIFKNINGRPSLVGWVEDDRQIYEAYGVLKLHVGYISFNGDVYIATKQENPELLVGRFQADGNVYTADGFVAGSADSDGRVYRTAHNRPRRSEDCVGRVDAAAGYERMMGAAALLLLHWRDETSASAETPHSPEPKPSRPETPHQPETPHKPVRHWHSQDALVRTFVFQWLFLSAAAALVFMLVTGGQPEILAIALSVSLALAYCKTSSALLNNAKYAFVPATSKYALVRFAYARRVGADYCMYAMAVVYAVLLLILRFLGLDGLWSGVLVFGGAIALGLTMGTAIKNAHKRR